MYDFDKPLLTSTAIRLKLIRARINQVHKKITVTYVHVHVQYLSINSLRMTIVQRYGVGILTPSQFHSVSVQSFFSSVSSFFRSVFFRSVFFHVISSLA